MKNYNPSVPRRSQAVVLAVLIALVSTLVAAAPRADARGGSTTIGEVVEWIGAAPLHAQGSTGAGIDVAVIDTGVDPVPGLDGAGKVVAGPDLSFEAGDPALRGRDTYGHGTVMASIIAGDDAPGGFQGVAPGSRIVSLKVADNTGAVDVSQVIAALDWVTENGRTNGLNIRVVNLSYVTDSEQGYLVDPLAHAVERAWAAGYVVVVAAGNAGGDTKRLGNPAADPYVIAVAASDDRGAASFSNRGSNTRVPDVLAPGDRVLGLAAPQSRLVQDNPSAFIDGRFLRGSGTSQATAIVSGAAALLLEQRPELTPDQVKALLILGTVDSKGQGRGSSNEVTAGVSEYFDLLDAEAELRSRIHELEAEARRGSDAAQQLEVDAAALRVDAAAATNRAAQLEARAKRLKDEGKKDEAEEAKDSAKVAQDEAKALDAAAKALEDEAHDHNKRASDLEHEVEKLRADADRIRDDAEAARVPEHLRERRIAEGRRAEAAELLVEADRLRVQSEERAADADALYAQAENVSTDPEIEDSKAAEDAAKEIEKLAKQVEKQAEDLAKDVERAVKDADKALEEAVKADERADKALRELEDAADQIFSDWTGRRLGNLEFGDRSGAGLIDVERAAALPAFDAVQNHARSDGSGSLEAARGTNHVLLPDGSLLDGEVSFTGSTWTGSTWTGSTWTGSTWTGSTWTGSTWTGSTWTGSTWTGSTWMGSTWTGAVWTGSTWTGAVWTGSTWTGAVWTGSTWTGSTWTGSTWSGASWD